MEEVGELHVDWSHRASVLHDPVFVHVWSIVVAGRARMAQKVKKKKEKKNCLQDPQNKGLQLTVKKNIWNLKKTLDCYFSQTPAKSSLVLDMHK